MKGKTALISGSTTGLGLQTAQALAAQGCNIVMTGLGEPARIEADRAAIAAEHGVDVRFIPADLRRPDEIAALVAEAHRHFGSVDILINNAAIRHPYMPVEDFETSWWDDGLAVNISAAFHLTRLTVRRMKEARWGRIVNISSNLGVFGVPNRVSYVTTKTAILGLTRAVAMETRDYDVTCNAICPSAFLGERAEGLVRKMMEDEGLSYEAAIEAFLKSRGRSRFVSTVPAMIVFLCGEGGKDMTGATIPVDLGSTAGQPASATPPVDRK